MSVAVVGSGAFGTALAISLSGNGPVVLWARSGKQARTINRDRMNTVRLPGVRLPDSITVTSDLETASACDVVLLAIPVQSLRAFLVEHEALLGNRKLVACCKGVEAGSGLGPVGIVRSATRCVNPALLTGPSFAGEIARGLPTALTLACEDPETARYLQEEVSTSNLRLYRTDDVAGAEAGGALKNVIAIGCGAVMGAGLGESARAALMTRGYAEMVRFAVARGARPETLSGLSGFGDLALTCGSEQSRNFRRGLAIGRGVDFDATETVEGVATAKAAVEAARSRGMELPIATAVVALLQGNRTIAEVTEELLSRPLREE